MGKMTFLAFIVMVLPFNVLPQETPSFKMIDQQTLENYNNQQWHEVIYWGKLGLDAGYDYYYLRVRLGISYFKIGKYLMAIPHFEKSLEFNTDNWLSLEYLYNCFLFSGQSHEAEKLKGRFPEALSKSLGLEKASFLQSIYIETGPTFSNNYAENGRKNLMGKPRIYGEEDLYGDNYYTHLGINFNFGKGFNWYLGYSNLVVDKRKQVQFTTNEVDRIGRNYYDWGYENIYENREIAEDITYDYRVLQNELHTNLVIPLGKSWRIVPALHLIHDSYNPLSVKYNPESGVDTAFMIYADSSYGTFNYYEIQYGIDQYDTNYINFVASLNVSKQIKWLNIAMSVALSNLNGKMQHQYGLSFIYFPMGNLDFYGQTLMQVSMEEKDTKSALYQMIGLKIINNCWLELFSSFGDMSNMSEKNAFVVYNLTDKIKYRLGAVVIVPVGDHVELSLRYQFFEKEGQWFQYSGDENGQFRVQANPYQTQQIIGGLKWKL